MATEPFDATTFIGRLLGRGWHWGGASGTRLVHPTDEDFYLLYDPAADRLTISPALDEHLKLVIPTPASKARSRA